MCSFFSELCEPVSLFFDGQKFIYPYFLTIHAWFAKVFFRPVAHCLYYLHEHKGPSSFICKNEWSSAISNKCEWFCAIIKKKSDPVPLHLYRPIQHMFQCGWLWIMSTLTFICSAILIQVVHKTLSHNCTGFKYSVNCFLVGSLVFMLTMHQFTLMCLIFCF